MKIQYRLQFSFECIEDYKARLFVNRASLQLRLNRRDHNDQLPSPRQHTCTSS